MKNSSPTVLRHYSPDEAACLVALKLLARSRLRSGLDIEDTQPRQTNESPAESKEGGTGDARKDKDDSRKSSIHTDP